MSLTQAHGKSTDATQEIITLGIGNIAGSFVGAMPISASFGRSAVQSSSGVRTPMVNVFSSESSPPYPSLIHSSLTDHFTQFESGVFITLTKESLSHFDICY